MSQPAPSYDGSRALLLGASGFIGRWVARQLSQAHAHVIAAVRQPASFGAVASAWEITGDVVELDALDAGAVDRVIAAARPDVVFNLVGYGVDRSETNADMMGRLNTELVRQLVTAIAAHSPSPSWKGRRLVHIGSALEYGLATGVVHEDTPPLPHTEYGRTKLAGTQLLQSMAAQANLPSVTARAFTVFGPGEHRGRLLPTIREAAVTGARVKLSSGMQRRDFAYVEEVADGLLRLALSSGAPGEVVNLATGVLRSVREFAEIAAGVLGVGPDRLDFGAEPVRADEMQIAGVSVDRLRHLTGWLPTADLDGQVRRASNFEDRVARNSR